MPTEAPPLPPPPPLPEGRIQGREAFADLVRQAVQTMAVTRWTPIVFSDPDFADWPLGERAVIEGLHAWAGRGRQIRWLAHDFSALRQLHPRLVQWRTTWSHIVEAHACSSNGSPALPSAIWTPVWCMERIDPEHGVMVAGSDAPRRLALRERLQACWDRGTPSFPASVLGL
ncbi:MAG: hypothetical protein ACLGH2_05935 [Gammaproteobacteria bacterium]